MPVDPAAKEAIEIARKKAAQGDDYEIRTLEALRDYPVSIEQFIRDREFLGSEALYPAILDELVELNNPLLPGYEHRSRLWTCYSEAILTGAIGTGKSTVAIYSMAYQLYVLSCFRSPHIIFGLDPASEITFIFQNKTERLAKAVDFDRFKALIERSPYFQKHFPIDRRVKSELRFPRRIVVKPVAGTDTAVIGQNVYCALIDEVNFMDQVDRSRRSYDGREYDQAMALYQSVARRRASRFMKYGRLPGLLCLVSSRRYPGQFTDIKEAERKRQTQETGRTSIYLFDKRPWEVKPPGTYCGETFKVFAGDENHTPRILEGGEEPEDGTSIKVPIEHRPEFEADMLNALRDVAGVSTMALHPFLANQKAVSACFGDHNSLLSRTDADYTDRVPTLLRRQVFRPELIRFAHLDLSLTGDATGVAMGCVSSFKTIERGEEQETLPVIRMDFTLLVIPPRGGEISLEDIRALLYSIRGMGINLRFVSADSFQSADTIQQLRRQGFTTGIQSIDKTPIPYEFLKSAIYDGRLQIPEDNHLKSELMALEWDSHRGKVDHQPKKSKDIADAVAGVVYGLVRRREVWSQHDVRPTTQAPSLVKSLMGLAPGSVGQPLREQRLG